MPEKIESYKCLLCNKTHATLNEARVCEHGHITFYIKDNQLEEINVLGRIYKPVTPPKDAFTFQTKQEEQDWHDLMVIGSRCG